MLDRLPIELLLRTLELAAPLDYSPSFYLERRQLLRNCCLVSKRVCSVAQSMLPEVFVMTDSVDVDFLTEQKEEKSRGSAVKVLVLKPTYASAIDPLMSVKRAVKMCKGVIDLRLTDVGSFHLDWLSDASGRLLLFSPQLPAPYSRLRLAPELQSLVALGEYTALLYPPASRILVLPKLLELSLAIVSAPLDIFKHFPTPSTTPSLRSLALERLSISNSADYDPLPLDSLSPALVQQLDVLALDSGDTIPSHLLALNPVHTIIDGFHLSTTSFPPPHAGRPYSIRLYWSPTSFKDVDRAVARGIVGLEEWLDAVRNSTLSLHPPRTLILPRQLQQTAEKDESFMALFQKCRELNLEVVWEEQEDFEDRSSVSKAFWRKKKRERQERRDMEERT
jgi:hypothetical protein